MYLMLVGGRMRWDESMADAADIGFDGPVFKVKSYVRVVYSAWLWADFADCEDREGLRFVDDVLYYDGKYYSDWMILDSGLRPNNLEMFDRRKAEVQEETMMESR